MAMVGQVGGASYGAGTPFVDTLANANPINVSYTNLVPVEYITGALATPITHLVAYEAPLEPQGLTTTSNSASITVSFIKDQNVDEVAVMFNGEEVFVSDAYSSLSSYSWVQKSDGVTKVKYSDLSKPWNVDVPLTPPSGVTVDTLYTLYSQSGLFNMQQNNTSTPAYGNLAQALSSFFTVTTESGTTKYNIKIPVGSGSSQAIRVYYASRVSGSLVYSLPATANASAAVPPGQVVSSSFSIAPTSITVNWTAPTSLGGAGQVAYAGAAANSSVLYKLNLYTANNYNNKVALLSVSNISANTYTFSGLSNYNSSNAGNTTYFVEVKPYFYQQGDVTKPAEAPATLINKGIALTDAFRPGVAPLTPSLTATVDSVQGNRVTLSYVIPSNTAYPISELKVYDNAVPGTVVKMVNSGLTNGSTVNIDITKTDLATLLNGRNITFKVVATPAYTYAQNYADVTVSVTPRKKITSAQVTLTNPSADKATYGLSVQTQGTAVTSFVAVGKTASGTLQVVQGSVAAGTLLLTQSGSATANDAALQTANSSFLFPMAVDDVAFFLMTADGVVNKVFPSSSTAFGLQAV